ncbi:MAG: HEAT repeat domain-containing protein [Candidatus Thorarchaeota archaeon]
MSIEKTFKDLPKRLLMADGLKSIFFLIKAIFESKEEPLFSQANVCLTRVKTLVSDEGSYDFDEVSKSLSPLVESALQSEEHRLHAAWAIAILIKRGFHFPSAIPTMIKWLDSDDREIMRRAVWILRNASSDDNDISGAIQGLGEVANHDEWHIRAMASEAISNEMIRAGLEQPLEPIEGILNRPGFDSDWTVHVYHRPRYAQGANPSKVSYAWNESRMQERCANCGYDEAVCVHFHDDSGTGWRDRLWEYQCPACNKFTVYHYFD